MKRYSTMRVQAVLSGAFLIAFGHPSRPGSTNGNRPDHGFVTDSTGAVVPDAKVSLTNQQTGLSRDTTSNESGAYTFPTLPVGYIRSRQRQGFSVARRTDIQLNVDQVVRIGLQLSVGTTSETVNVQAKAMANDSETAESVRWLRPAGNRAALNGRNFYNFSCSATGLWRPVVSRAMRQGAGNAISINGSRPTSNNYLLDGYLQHRYRARHARSDPVGRCDPGVQGTDKPTRQNTVSARTRSTSSQRPEPTNCTDQSSGSSAMMR